MDWLPSLPLDWLAQAVPLLGGMFLAACCVFLLTATLTACSIPGVLIPMSLTSGALLGATPAVAAVALGALAGSQLLFTLTRRFGADRIRARAGPRLARLEARLQRFGPAAIVALRVAGAPGPLVTAGGALTPMRPSVFAGATLLGLLPSVTIAAATGAGGSALF